MTTILAKADSGSSVESVEFGHNTSITSLPVSVDRTRWYVDPGHPQKVGLYDDAGTALESDLLGLKISKFSPEVFANPNQLIGGDFRILVFPLYGTRGTDWLQWSEAYVASLLEMSTSGSQHPDINFASLSDGMTSVVDDRLGGFPVETDSFDGDEHTPELLQDALCALAEVKTIALEEDCDEPSEMAIRNAEVVIRKLFELSPRAYDVYPMGGGEIAIDAGHRGHRIGVFCYPDGKMQYVILLGDEPQDIRKDGIHDIPTDLLDRALSRMDA